MSDNLITAYSIGRRRNARQIFLALFIFSSILFFSFHSGNSISKGISATAVTTVTPTPNVSNDSFSVELDRNTFILPCPKGYSCRQSDAYSAPIVVTVSNNKVNNNSLRYKYTISGGRIIGDSAKVYWDFPNAEPGTYHVTVVIAEQSGNELQTITKTITVLDYQDDADRCISCPELSVDAPTMPTQAGETMVFTANARYGISSGYKYDWKISNGKIIEGHGTPTIKVATDSSMDGKTVEATVNFRWYCSEVCNNTASASGLVTKKRKKKRL